MRRSRAIGPGGIGVRRRPRVGITWPGHDPRGHGAPAQRLVAQAGRPADAAGRSAGPDRRASRAEPILAILHAGYGEHEVVTVDGDDRQGHRPGRAAGELRRAGLVGRRQAALRRRRVRRPDLPLRPRRRPALEQDGLRVSRPQGVPGRAEPARGRAAKSTSGRRPAWRSPRTARRSTSPPRSATRWGGSTPSRGRFRARSRSRPTAIPTAWPRRVAQAALRQPLEQGRGRRRRHRHVRGRRPAGRPRSIPTRCCWRAGARSSTSPTPTATRSP